MPSKLIAEHCTGEFGCGCAEARTSRARSINNLRGHGTRTKYNRGCRCLPCKRAYAKYIREYRAKKRKEKRDGAA